MVCKGQDPTYSAGGGTWNLHVVFKAGVLCIVPAASWIQILGLWRKIPRKICSRDNPNRLLVQSDFQITDVAEVRSKESHQNEQDIDLVCRAFYSERTNHSEDAQAIEENRADAVDASRAVLKGKIAEQID